MIRATLILAALLLSACETGARIGYVLERTGNAMRAGPAPPPPIIQPPAFTQCTGGHVVTCTTTQQRW